MKKYIDTHCHPYLNKTKDIKETINNFFIDEWKAMIVIWTDNETNEKALELAKENKNIFCTIWIHPCDVYWLDLEKTISKLEEIYINNEDLIVWIWETWLDYYWIYKEDNSENEILNKKETQKKFFKAQINLAKKYNLPFIIHNRDSKDDVLKILKEEWYKKFIFHCYSEDYEYAKKLTEFSDECYLSFSGIVTFKNAKDIQDTASKIDIKYILAETDAPYLTPTPFRWKEENEPKFTRYVIEYIAYLRWENKDNIYDEIFNNSKKAFSLDI